MRRYPVLVLITAFIALAACSDDGSPVEPKTLPPPQTLSDGVLVPLSVGNEWHYLTTSLGGWCGTLSYDSIRVTGVDTIDGTEWHSVYFTMMRRTAHMRNSASGLEVRLKDTARLVNVYPVIEYVPFTGYSFFTNSGLPMWLTKTASGQTDSLLTGSQQKDYRLQIKYDTVLPPSDSTTYSECFAPGLGLLYFQHEHISGDNRSLFRSALISYKLK